MKTSGQLGTKVFGNRSYGQKPMDSSSISKAEKSGYYITANFYEKTLTLLRFGWIDASDWKPQRSPTGQAASLSNEVYQHKLVEIEGDYRLNAPVALIEGVGPKTARIFASENITTIHELLDYTGENSLLQKFQERVKARGY
ncbi:MAG: ScaI family restriction endonuclease [Blastocatellia bacterium]|nr:ScaI family restriction endonuclease [Blastocatellia bacterium]